ncbi:MAG: hypothetical protein F4039_00610 [Gammaproteobacteria bacterium]|nr:hypothetical protein [Gammaproteobacteria bacterium]
MIKFVNLVSPCLRLILSGGMLVLVLIATNLYARDLPFPDEQIPVGQPDPPPDPPEESVLIEYGRCTVDYSEIEIDFDGTTLGDIYEIFEGIYGEELGHLFGPEHHDVFLNPPVVPAKFSVIRPGTWGEPAKDRYRARGFYGPIHNVTGFRKQMRLWFEYREIIYLDGSIIDKTRKRDICTTWGSGGSRDVTNNASSVVFRYQQEWEDFHLIERNCQHWAFMTLTGFDLNGVDNPEDYVPEEE